MRKRTEESANLGVTVQPQLLLLGHNICRPDQYFIVLNNIVYEVDNLVKAVDLCFKSFFVFNLDYPVQAFDPWSFIQKGLYNITTPYDKIVPRVTDLISKININCRA